MDRTPATTVRHIRTPNNRMVTAQSWFTCAWAERPSRWRCFLYSLGLTRFEPRIVVEQVGPNVKSGWELANGR